VKILDKYTIRIADAGPVLYTGKGERIGLLEAVIPAEIRVIEHAILTFKRRHKKLRKLDGTFQVSARRFAHFEQKGKQCTVYQLA